MVMYLPVLTLHIPNALSLQDKTHACPRHVCPDKGYYEQLGHPPTSVLNLSTETTSKYSALLCQLHTCSLSHALSCLKPCIDFHHCRNRFRQERRWLRWRLGYGDKPIEHYVVKNWKRVYPRFWVIRVGGGGGGPKEGLIPCARLHHQRCHNYVYYRTL